MVTSRTKTGAWVAILGMLLGLVSACGGGGSVVFHDETSGRAALLSALQGKYQLTFSIVGEFSIAKNDYGETYALATIAAATDLSVTARAALSDRGSLTDGYSAQVFRGQVAGSAERICDDHRAIATCVVDMLVPNSAERWDRGSLQDFLAKSGVELHVSASFAPGLDDGTYAEQGFELVSALEKTGIHFLIQAYRRGETQRLFVAEWSPSDRPGWITKSVIMDYITIQRLSSTAK